MKIRLLALFVLGLLGGFSWAWGVKPLPDDHKVFTPSDLQWNVVMPALPKGAEATLLEGDPGMAGPFTIRIKFPANYKIPPHYQPSVAHITVISGTFNIGWGDEFDAKKGKQLPAGSFVMVETGVHYYTWTDDGAVIQVSAIGPWPTTYVNPDDDPRNTKK